jgi:hypothetical protein
VTEREALNLLIKAAEGEGHYAESPGRYQCAICEVLAELLDAGYYDEGDAA